MPDRDPLILRCLSFLWAGATIIVRILAFPTYGVMRLTHSFVEKDGLYSDHSPGKLAAYLFFGWIVRFLCTCLIVLLLGGQIGGLSYALGNALGVWAYPVIAIGMTLLISLGFYYLGKGEGLFDFSLSDYIAGMF
eukprot:TRINITY_DN20627_c0_g1_i1.p1 TRINITY_DN20627_c0_g1~~TRINITY_DN20627_c0_g1_i1.p1  ORF type:complete len:135 (-),score=7.96 TRINITY_DN20627_c0_g1_i1:70-474(-)